MAISSARAYPIPNDEGARLSALERFRVAGSASESQFDEIAKLVSLLLKAPIAIISLVEQDRQWLKARIGLDAQETPRNVSFCAHTIMTDQVMVVPDATKDRRFSENPLVTGRPHIRFYAGAPLTTPDGYRLGALCAIDTRARPPLTRMQEGQLKNFADLAMTHFKLRRDKLARG